MKTLLLLVAFTFAASPPLRADEIPFEDLAHKALERMAPADANPETLSLEDAFAHSSVHLRLGLFEVFLGRASAQRKDVAGHYLRALGTLLDLQRAWLAWLAPLQRFEQAEEDLDTLEQWVGKLKAGRIQALARGEGEAELLTGLEASDRVREAAERLAVFMGSGACLGLDREDQAEPLVLAADRTEFIELLAFCGWLYPYLRDVYWNDDISTWTSCYVDRYKFIAMEFAGAGAHASWMAGTPMDEYAEDGFAQQVTQLAANSLIDDYFGGRIPPSLAGALSVNLTIDVFGMCDTRVDGDLRSRRTEAYEIFIPGGNSDGGWLPAVAADSRWREKQGKDHFIGILKTSQKDGAARMARAKGKLTHFGLENDGKTKHMAVSAPFLGSAALGAATPPEEFVGDYKEFLRSYRSCFIYWLREKSQGKARASEEAFARWLLHLAADEELALEPSLQDSFGAPLSAAEVTPEVLEGAFLAWLRRAK